MHPVVRPLDPLASEWVTGLFLLCLIIMTAVQRGAPRKWRVLVQGAFRMRMGRQALRDEVDLQDRNFLGLLFVGILLVALFLWQSAHILQITASVTYLQLAGIVATGLVAQGLFTRLIAGLARTDTGASEFVFTGALLFTILGLVLFPVVVITAFQPEWRRTLIWVGGGLIGITLVFRWVRGVWIGVGEGIPIRHIILYLCAAEVIPLSLVIEAMWSPLQPTSHL